MESAAQAATALEPLAGAGASILFALGVVGVGFLAVPVMTTGAAYSVGTTPPRPTTTMSASSVPSGAR
ncbi:divalent metal cation transporter [Methylobacterium nigriterrae]|uniref:divalent metal cation transporter n=1 Tax=Methylobacterium nigriterrae TaxID=3127512 RepID=UPI0030136227